MTTPNGHGLRVERTIEGTREWRREKWKLSRELATEMMPSRCMLRYRQIRLLLLRMLRLTGPGPAATPVLTSAPLIGQIFNNPPARATVSIVVRVGWGSQLKGAHEQQFWNGRFDNPRLKKSEATGAGVLSDSVWGHIQVALLPLFCLMQRLPI